MTRLQQCLAFAVLSLSVLHAAVAQILPDSLVQQLRAGAARSIVPGDSVVLPLVGTPTLPLVEVRVNGTGPWRFLIDLGSNVTLLRRNVVDASHGSVLVERASTDIVRVAELQLGEARLEDLNVGSYDKLDVDGVLGYNVLQYSSFTLDFPGQQLVLHHQPLPVPDGVTVLPYQLRGRMPYVRIAIGRDSLLVNLDTGAAAPGRTVTNNQTGSTRILEGTLSDTLRFGVLEIATPLVYVNPEVQDAWLGAAAMNGAVWTFDPRRQRVRVAMPVRR